MTDFGGGGAMQPVGRQMPAACLASLDWMYSLGSRRLPSSVFYGSGPLRPKRQSHWATPQPPALHQWAAPGLHHKILGSVVGPQLVSLPAFEVGEISPEQQHAQLLWDAAQKLSGGTKYIFPTPSPP